MSSGIYQIKCLSTGKIYIGSAVNIPARWGVHRHLLKLNKHHSIHLQRAWAKYGADSFEFTVLENVCVERLIEREQAFIDVLKPFGIAGFNISPNAGNTRGAKRTPEQIEKTASKNRGRRMSESQKAKISASVKGREHGPETIAKMRSARLANNHQVGRELTERQKAALHKSGAEHPWYGRKHSAETAQRISEAKSYAVVQVSPDGSEKIWRTAAEAAIAVNLRSPGSIYRAVCDPSRRAAKSAWRRVTDRAVVS